MFNSCIICLQVEEQMVPSGGFSPQPDTSSNDGSSNGGQYSFGYSSNYDTSSVTPFDVGTYGNLADTFDLSLLGDSYDDCHDMATVPSPMACLEAMGWTPTSFYAPSPSNSEFRAFSPDCLKPYSNATNGDQLTPAVVSNNPMLTNANINNSLVSMCGNNGISTLSPSTNDVGNNERNALLKHYLEDTTFQSKFLPTITVNDDDLDAIMVRQRFIPLTNQRI